LISVAIITISDKGSRGEREDLSGPAIKELILPLPAQIQFYQVIPDETKVISHTLKDCSDKLNCDLVITTGGTGVGPRDVTPEATLAVIEREIPGMAEVMRMESLKKTPHAMISRAVVGIRGHSLIINLPGSPKAVKENLSALLPALSHAIDKIKGDDADCAIS
jgi:molybdenum cofactor synthesis domain-containing protein